MKKYLMAAAVLGSFAFQASATSTAAPFDSSKSSAEERLSAIEGSFQLARENEVRGRECWQCPGSQRTMKLNLWSMQAVAAAARAAAEAVAAGTDWLNGFHQ